MGPIPFAFSVQHFINSVGADAGFASILGLAILVLLYFAQARETSSLRDHAYESAQRIQELEGRLAHASRSQPAVAPPPRAAAAAPTPPLAGAAATPGAAALSRGRQPAAARPLANPVAGAPAPGSVAAAGAPSASAPSGEQPSAPGAPANVGAPALAAATRLIPGAGTGTGGEPGAGDAELARESDLPVDATSVAAPPAPSTAAGGANGGAREPLLAPVAAPQPQAQRSPQTRTAAAAAPGRRPPPPRAPLLADERPSRLRRLLPLLIAAVALAAIVIALLVLTSSGTSTKPTASTGAASNAPVPTHRSGAAGFNASTVTVAVLNGTATSGLAHRVAVKLQRAGYKQGTIATAIDQTRKATGIAYMPSHKRAALAVASTLQLASASVQPIDPTTQAVACPQPAPCTATVVITVGADLASTP